MSGQVEEVSMISNIIETANKSDYPNWLVKDTTLYIPDIPFVMLMKNVSMSGAGQGKSQAFFVEW